MRPIVKQKSTRNLLWLPALALALSTAPAWSDASIPIVDLQFNEGTGTTSVNAGSAGGTATFTATTPTWSPQAAVNAGPYSVDFGATQGAYAIDIPQIAALKSLKSFTITGWVNCQNSGTGPGGNRIVEWINAGGDGLDLAYQSDGSLGIGINQWNDVGGVKSNTGKITTSSTANFSNWRFFAVTYDGTQSTNNVKFYFGSIANTATLDVCRSYARGTLGANIGPTFTIGNHTTANRGSAQMFRGQIDQIRVFGSTVDGSAVKTASEIVYLQNNPSMSGRGGLRYEEWDGISGSAVQDLVTYPDFPESPTWYQTMPSFDGFQQVGDNLGVRMSGWVLAPETGNYTFWVASDDNSEFRISTDANPANKRLVASVTGYTGYLEWTKYTSQQSAPISLVAGQYYYVETRMKENSGNDNISVGWQLPSGSQERPIPAGRVFLQPDVPDAVFPSVVNLYEPGTSNKKATIGWHKETNNNYFFINTFGANPHQIKIDDNAISTVDSVDVAKLRADAFVSTPKWKVVPDYVFEPGYKMQSLSEVEAYIKENKHLPEIPSAQEMAKGVDLAEMNLKLLKKVEELTMRMIEMDKDLQAQKANNSKDEKKTKPKQFNALNH